MMCLLWLQERQAVSNVTCAVLDHHITIHYPNAKKALLTNSKTLLRDVQDLIGAGNIQVMLQHLQLFRYHARHCIPG